MSYAFNGADILGILSSRVTGMIGVYFAIGLLFFFGSF
jgi:hypothetical protein